MRVFISHSSKDNSELVKVEGYFKKFNIPYWADNKDLQDDDNKITAKIKKKVEESTHFLLLFSKKAKSSVYVRDEINWVVQKNKDKKISIRIIKLDEVEIPAQFEDPHYYSVSENQKIEDIVLEIINKIRPEVKVQIEKFKQKIHEDYEAFPKENLEKNAIENYKPIIKNFKKFDGNRLYVSQPFEYLSNKKEKVDVLNHVISIVSKRERKFIPLVADYGSGKSALSHALLNYFSEKNDAKFPIFIPLGDLANHDDHFDHMVYDIFQFIREEYNFMISYEEFLELIQKGQIIFLLDALDEMSETIDPKIAQNNLHHTSKLAKKNIVILTCRRTYFSDSTEQDLISHNELIKINDFSQKNFDDFLIKKFENNETEAEQVKDEIEKNNIKDFVRKPLFLNTICENYDKLNEFPIINQAAILTLLTDNWIIHDVQKKHSPKEYEIVTNQRQRISEILAVAESIKNNPIGREDIEKEVKEILKKTTSLEKYYADAINCTFLSREPKDKFRFILRPIQEYFIACKIIHDIDSDQSKTIFGHVEAIKSEETFNFIKDLIDIRWAIKPHVFRELPDIPEFEQSDCEDEYIEIKNTIESERKILISRTDGGKTLQKIILNSRKENPKPKAGSLLRILNMTSYLMPKLDLSELNLKGATLPNANLSNVNLKNADLSGANLSKAVVSNGDLSNANLEGADLSNCQLGPNKNTSEGHIDLILKRANLKGTNLSNAFISSVNFEGTNLESTDLRNATIVDSNFIHSTFVESKMDKSKMTKVDFRECVLNGVSFKKSKLCNVNFSNSNMTLTNFELAVFEAHVSFRQANLEAANFRQVQNPERGDFEGAYLDKVKHLKK